MLGGGGRAGVRPGAQEPALRCNNAWLANVRHDWGEPSDFEAWERDDLGRGRHRTARPALGPAPGGPSHRPQRGDRRRQAAGGTPVHRRNARVKALCSE